MWGLFGLAEWPDATHSNDPPSVLDQRDCRYPPPDTRTIPAPAGYASLCDVSKLLNSFYCLLAPADP